MSNIETVLRRRAAELLAEAESMPRANSVFVLAPKAAAASMTKIASMTGSDADKANALTALIVQHRLDANSAPPAGLAMHADLHREMSLRAAYELELLRVELRTAGAL